MPTLGHIIERNARLFPERTAVVFRDRRWSHREYARRVRKLASGLYARGLRRQDRFSILAMNCSEFLEAYGAAEWAGFVLNTVNWRLAAPEIAWVLRDAAPKIIVFEQQYTAVIETLRPQLGFVQRYVCIGDAPAWAESFVTVLESGAEEGPTDRARAGDPLCIIYTSGTTGRPKGVVHTNRSYARLAEILSSELQLGGDGRLLAIAPLFHIGARSLVSGQQWRGGTIVLLRGFDPEEVMRTIEQERITAVHLVPTMVQAILDAPGFGRYDLSSLRMLMYAAAPMPVPLVKRALAAFGPILVNGYGQTEINLPTLLHAHQHEPDGAAAQVKRLGSVGQPHPQSEIRIVDETGNDRPPNVAGEVLARSDTAMAGYWNNASATRETLRNGWVFTGDIGYLDEEGFLFLVDRKKDMIISGGENIYSREVEEALVAHPAVKEAAAIGVPDSHWGEAVKGVVVPKDGATPVSGDLIAHCRSLIASYKCPKSIEFVDALPLLPTGKVNKVALRLRFGGQA